MSITIGDKIKQKNQQTFKLMDAIDINGAVTGWQNPVKTIFGILADITGLSVGDHFIVRDVTGTWTQFTQLDIYDRTVTTAVNNAIYILGPSIDNGESAPIYLVASPTVGMIVFDKTARVAKKYDGLPANWSNLITAAGVTGETLRAKDSFSVNTTTPGVGYYDPATYLLTITAALLDTDNINLFVNGLKYSNTGPTPAISYVANATEVAWIVANAGFDLIAGDVIELEIFNNE